MPPPIHRGVAWRRAQQYAYARGGHINSYVYVLLYVYHSMTIVLLYVSDKATC